MLFQDAVDEPVFFHPVQAIGDLESIGRQQRIAPLQSDADLRG
jgi:hypothetical protein